MSFDPNDLCRCVFSQFCLFLFIYLYWPIFNMVIVGALESFLTRGYAKRRNGFLLGLRYANVSLAHSGVESS